MAPFSRASYDSGYFRPTAPTGVVQGHIEAMTTSQKRIRSNLTLNLSAVIILWVLISLVGALLFLVWVARQSAEEQVSSEGEFIVGIAASACMQPLVENDYPAIRERVQAMIDRQTEAVFCQVLSTLQGGSVVSVGDQEILLRWMEGDTSGLEIFESPIYMNDSRTIEAGSVIVGYSRERIDASLRQQVWTISIGIGVSFLVVSIFLVYVLQRVIGRPLASLDRQSARLAGGDLDTSIHLDSQTEFGHLAAALEAMRIQVSEQIQRLQRLSGELARSSDSQKMLFRELDHRVRNNLAGLASLVNLSSRRSRSIEAFADSIRGRVHAMSVVHSMLSQEHWDPIDLEEMIRLLIPPGAKGTIEMEGNTKVLIPSRQATACGMIFQELMANSLKYGAWSAGGVVHVLWQPPEVDEDGRRVLKLHWRERGGPGIDSEVTPGTGTGLIEGFVKSEMNGDLELHFKPEGVRHDFTFRLGEKEQDRPSRA